jgi:aerobic carbon-monoxide dehydrogenase medium subunit
VRQQMRGAGLVSPTQSALPPFRLIRAGSIPDVREALRAHPGATLAAGCSDLVAQVREGLTPHTLISVRRLPELLRAEHTDGELSLGAALTHSEGPAHPAVRQAIPSLAAAWASIATVRIRFRATVGGNLMARRYRYEMGVILGALDARMHFTGPHGDADVAVDEFVRSGAPGTPEAVDRGLLHRLTVETASLRWYSYDRSMRPVTTVAVAVRAPEAGESGGRVIATVGSEYRRPVRLSAVLPGAELTAADVRPVAARLAAGLPDWTGDYAGTADYRRHLVEVLAGRQLTAALGARP